MNLVIGIVIFILGLAALFAWFADLVPFFKGLLVCSLLLWGIVGIVVGLAQRRAKNHLSRAANDQPSEEESREETQI